MIVVMFLFPCNVKANQFMHDMHPHIGTPISIFAKGFCSRFLAAFDQGGSNQHRQNFSKEHIKNLEKDGMNV
ncbi:hypothetical protein C7W93_05485 [Glaciimonas sp. PCH181]|nr:hypothetical protein C7W93_05485 [Glaciimonas sp. PCH181]